VNEKGSVRGSGPVCDGEDLSVLVGVAVPEVAVGAGGFEVAEQRVRRGCSEPSGPQDHLAEAVDLGPCGAQKDALIGLAGEAELVGSAGDEDHLQSRSIGCVSLVFDGEAGSGQ
jgi:hypothetical protein